MPHTRVDAAGRYLIIAIILGWIFLAAASRALGATVPTGFSDDPQATGLSEPVGLAVIPDAAGSRPRVLFIELRTARVGLILNGAVTTVGFVPGVASVENERGLLGIAVDPRWPAKPYVYVHCTDGRNGHHVAISRFKVIGDLQDTATGQLMFDSASRYDLLDGLSDDAWNHNGGTVRFGVDQKLYVSLGDDEKGCFAQDPTQLVGKILRLDVTRLPDGPGGPPPLALLIPPGNPFAAQPDSNAMLVWTYGHRNPFRFHIDPTTGDLFIADVGQDTWEEVDQAVGGGGNFGWPWREGPEAYVSCTGSPTAFASPIFTYAHTTGQCIMSGGVYRRPANGARRFPAEYDGDYFCMDYVVGFMRRLHASAGTWSIASPVAGQPSPSNWAEGMDAVTDVAETPDGSLWYARQLAGEIRRIAYQGTLAVDVTPRGLEVAPAAPNPSHGGVSLAWTQATAGTVRLAVVDPAGRRVRVVEPGAGYEAGPHSLVWDGRDDTGQRLAPGLYVATLAVGETTRRIRITLLR